MPIPLISQPSRTPFTRRLKPPHALIAMPPITPAIAAADWRPGLGGNDLEPVACELYPDVARHLAWLRRHGAARMSGSGACCFAEFATEAAARAAFAALPADMRGFVAAGREGHPLAEI